MTAAAHPTAPCPHCGALLRLALVPSHGATFSSTQIAPVVPADPAERFRQAQARKAGQAGGGPTAEGVTHAPTSRYRVEVGAPAVFAPAPAPFQPKPSSVMGLTLAALPAIGQGGLTSFELAKATKKPLPQVQSALSVLFRQGLATRDPVPHAVPRQRGGTVYRWRRAS